MRNFNPTALAARLGVAREEFPEFFQPSYFIHTKPNSDVVTRVEQTGWRCNLPDPRGNDPRACLWEPFLLRALGWPSVFECNSPTGGTDYKVNDRLGGWQPTPTAALMDAIDAEWAREEKE